MVDRQVYLDRREQLAKFLDALDPSKFNISSWVDPNRCGTAVCALGWCPTVFPKSWCHGRGHEPTLKVARGVVEHGAYTSARVFFGLHELSDDHVVDDPHSPGNVRTLSPAAYLFSTSGYRPSVTPKEVAARLREPVAVDTDPDA